MYVSMFLCKEIKKKKKMWTSLAFMVCLLWSNEWVSCYSEVYGWCWHGFVALDDNEMLIQQDVFRWILRLSGLEIKWREFPVSASNFPKNYQQFKKQLNFLNVEEERMLRDHKATILIGHKSWKPQFVSTSRTPDQHVRASPVMQHPCNSTYYYFEVSPMG